AGLATHRHRLAGDVPPDVSGLADLPRQDRHADWRSAGGAAARLDAAGARLARVRPGAAVLSDAAAADPRDRGAARGSLRRRPAAAPGALRDLLRHLPLRPAVRRFRRGAVHLLSVLMWR